MLAQFDVDTELTSAEIQVAGDLAYERGTYTLKLTDKTTGQVVADVENRHLHIMKRQSDGGWKTWRMMVNSAEPPAEAPRN
jgi:ketosteroid isomerase-like protein